MRQFCLAALVVATYVESAAAYQFDDSARWYRTATDGSGLGQGDPTTLTWGFVADGTVISGDEGSSASDLIAFLDGLYGSNGGGNDLTERPWFALFADSFNRWGGLSGLTYVYEPNNSGAAVDSTNWPLGTRDSVPDIRIGGHSIDGQSSGNTLAYNYYPDHGDMVIDTDNSDFFGDPVHNSRRLRNTVMHEQGHGLGLSHVESDNAAFLLERYITTSFDGPQLDDILAVHRGYGDVLEKDGGNDTYLTATPLGALASAGPLAIGTDADDTVVAATDTDFVSIDDNLDIDFFGFTVEQDKRLTVTLTPKGPTYNEGPETDPPTPQTPFATSTESDLALAVFGPDGTTLLLSADDTAAGAAEVISNLVLSAAGTYFVRVTGADDAAQLYQLDLSVADALLPGDVNLDGALSGLDVEPFVDRLLDGTYQAEADLNEDGVVNGLDVELFVATVVGVGASWQAVAEPSTLGLAALAIFGFTAGRRRRHGAPQPA